MAITTRVEHLVGLVVSDFFCPWSMILRDKSLYVWHIGIANTYFLVRHRPTSSGSSSSFWLIPTWTSAQNCCALVIAIFMETGGQLYRTFTVICVNFASQDQCSLYFIYRNATTLIAFWKNWNIPFQRWCHRYYQHFLVCVLECLTWGFFAYMFFFLCIKRHIYTRLVERNVSPSHAELLVFLMSAALCEVQSILLTSLERGF